jgi:four helix bundle protein
MGKSFLDLIVWQRAVDMTVSVYELTDSFPRKEIYGLTSQLRRAAVSVASNIAEGAGRGSKKEFRQFLNVARGSNCEVQTQLIIASRLNLTAHKDIEMAESLSHEVGRMLNGLLQSLLPDGQQPGTEN